MYLHVFGATQLVYGSVTLARCASLPYGQSWILPLAAVCLISEFLCTVLPSRILGVRRCGWTYVAALHVHLTLRTKRCSESVVASLLHLLLPCLPGTLGGQEAIHKKKTHPQVCLQLNQRLPILPGRLQPSTFGVYELNYCVRDGNRWILIAIATESVRVCTLKTTQKYIYLLHILLNVFV